MLDHELNEQPHPADRHGERADVPRELHLEGFRNDCTFHLVVRGRNALISLEALKSARAARCLVGKHATYSAPQHSRRGGVVKGAVRGLCVHAKALEIIISLASANDATGYHDALGAYDNHVLPLKDPCTLR